MPPGVITEASVPKTRPLLLLHLQLNSIIDKLLSS